MRAPHRRRRVRVAAASSNSAGTTDTTSTSEDLGITIERKGGEREAIRARRTRSGVSYTDPGMCSARSARAAATEQLASEFVSRFFQPEPADGKRKNNEKKNSRLATNSPKDALNYTWFIARVSLHFSSR